MQENEARELIRQVREIHVIPYSHHDYSWTNSRQWHIARYILLLTEALDAMEADPDYRFTIDNVVHSLLPLLKNRPDSTKRLRAAADRGQLGVSNGGWSLARPAYVGEETFLRNLMAGRAFFRQLLGEVDQYAFFNADTACGPSQLPQILMLAGYSAYWFLRPEEAMNRRGVPRHFVWKGLDGTEILAGRGLPCGIMRADWMQKDFDAQWDEVVAEYIDSDLAHRMENWPDTGLQAVYFGCDDSRPLKDWLDRPVDMPGFMARWNSREASHMHFSTHADFFRALPREKLPVWEGVVDPVEPMFNLPFKGDRALWRLRHRLDAKLRGAETLGAMCLLAGQPGGTAELAALWRSLFEITGHAMEWAFKEDIEPLERMVEGALSRAEQVAQNAMETLQMAFATPLPPLMPGHALSLYNPLPYTRDEVVRLRLSPGDNLAHFHLIDEAGAKIPYQLLRGNDRGTWTFSGSLWKEAELAVLIHLPGLGVSTLVCSPVKPETGNAGEAGYASGIHAGAGVGGMNQVITDHDGRQSCVMDNGWMRLTIEEGQPATIEHHGHTLQGPFGCLRRGKLAAFGGWVGSMEVSEWEDFVPEIGRLTAHGPLLWEYETLGRVGGEKASLILTLKAGDPVLHIYWRFLCQGEPCCYTARFGGDGNAQLMAGIPFGVEKRELEKEYYHSMDMERGIPGLFWARDFAVFAQEGLPLAAFQYDGGIYWKRDPAGVEAFLLRTIPLEHVTEGWVRQAPESFAGEGPQTFHLGLMLGGFDPPDYIRPQRHAREMSLPLISLPNLTGCGAAAAMAEVAGDVCVTAVFPWYDPSCFGPETILHPQSAPTPREVGIAIRLYDASGRGGTCRIHLPKAVHAQSTDFEGHVLEELTRREDAFTLNLNPWQIATVRFHW